MEKRPGTNIESQIVSFLQEQFDGIVSVEFSEDGTLYVNLSGSCANCPANEISCNEEIRRAVLKEFPEVATVSTRAYVSDKTMKMVRELLNI